jgi:hypothetical protein
MHLFFPGRRIFHVKHLSQAAPRGAEGSPLEEPQQQIPRGMAAKRLMAADYILNGIVRHETLRVGAHATEIRRGAFL